jgi:hypothetical protein
MTEAEWLTATDPTPMLAFLRDKATHRKMWLFPVGCLRVDELARDTPELRGVMHMEDEVERFFGGSEEVPLMDDRNRLVGIERLQDAFRTGFAERDSFRIAVKRRGNILRDIFGNPFRPVTADPKWFSSTALTLARRMYDTRDFSPMPILADALQDAGCENTDILAHCRKDGVHVRGCFVIDLLLGKE